MFRHLMLAIFRLHRDFLRTYTTDTTYLVCFLGVGKGLCGTEISFVSVVCAWSLTVSLVTHALSLAMSTTGFIILY